MFPYRIRIQGPVNNFSMRPSAFNWISMWRVDRITEILKPVSGVTWFFFSDRAGVSHTTFRKFLNPLGSPLSFLYQIFHMTYLMLQPYYQISNRKNLLPCPKNLGISLYLRQFPVVDRSSSSYFFFFFNSNVKQHCWKVSILYYVVTFTLIYVFGLCIWLW